MGDAIKGFDMIGQKGLPIPGEGEQVLPHPRKLDWKKEQGVTDMPDMNSARDAFEAGYSVAIHYTEEDGEEKVETYNDYDSFIAAWRKVLDKATRVVSVT